MAKDKGLTPPTKETKASATKGKKGDEKKDGDKATPDEPRQRRSKFAEMYPEDSAITVLTVDEAGKFVNPKKEGSASRDRYDHYSTSKTVGDFLVKGGTYADIAYDIGRMHISIEVVNKAA